ncbi:hypothetical protein [Streptomyces sp. NPDC060065]|uniref:hypothetical protein n=1 Tax=Streptomyces sp. NPDC060065 TaxID=3347050 RepID=UPI0036D08AA8
MRVTAAGTERVSLAALICTRTGHRPRLIYRALVDRGPRHGRRKGSTETDYARLLDDAHQQLDGPIVVVWDHLRQHMPYELPSSARDRLLGLERPEGNLVRCDSVETGGEQCNIVLPDVLVSCEENTKRVVAQRLQRR